VGTLDARSRNAVGAIIGVLLVWTVASLALPTADMRSSAFDPIGARIGPMTLLAAIASDRPAATTDIRRSDHPEAIPAVVSADAGMWAALRWVIRSMRSPTSPMVAAPLATSSARRGPPLLPAT
jgi:hypothetical protein